MATTIYNSNKAKYAWHTSDDDGLISMFFVYDNNSILAEIIQYDDDVQTIEKMYYVSTDETKDKELWNQIIQDDLEEFDTYFVEIPFDIFDNFSRPNGLYLIKMGAKHDLNEVLRSMLIALYTNITDKAYIPEDILDKLYTDAVDKLFKRCFIEVYDENNDRVFNDRVVPYDEHEYNCNMRDYCKYTPISCLAEHKFLYRHTYYECILNNLIELIKDNYM